MSAQKDKFDYFIERTDRDIGHMKERIDKLWEFKFFLLGGAAAISVLCSTLVTVIAFYFGDFHH